MSKLGFVVRKRFPRLYRIVIAIINYFLQAIKPYSIYITDNLGGSFKEYFISQDMDCRISMLKKEVDDESVLTVDVILQRFLHYPDARYRRRYRKKRPVIGGLLPAEEVPMKESIKTELKQHKKKYPFLSSHIEESVFYFFHGLRLLPKEVTTYIAGSDFIDLGAFVGDSSIALRQYDYRKIYSVEISHKSIGQYVKNLTNSGIPESKYRIIHAGIGAVDNGEMIRIGDNGSAGLSPLRKAGKYDEIEVPVRTLDSIVSEYGIEPRFIKVDIEGFALEFVKGAKNTLRKFRPVLSVAIYHNPGEFFETRMLLEETVDGYTFLIRKLSCGIRNNQCHSEVVLLAFPNEILSPDESS